MKKITVYYNGNAMLVYEDVARQLGVSNGQNVNSEERFWEILSAHALYCIDICKSKLN